MDLSTFLSTLGPLISAGGNVFNAFSQNSLGNQQLDLARNAQRTGEQNSALQLALQKRITDAMFGNSRDAEGNVTGYDEITNTFFANPTPERAELIRRGLGEQLTASDRRVSEGDAAKPWLSRLESERISPESMIGDLTRSRLGSLNDELNTARTMGYNQVSRAGGAGGEAVMRALAKERALRSDEIIADSNIRGKTLAEDVNTSSANRNLGVYNTLASRASGIPNPAAGVSNPSQQSFTPAASTQAGYSGGLLANQGNQVAQSGLNSGANRVGSVNPFNSVGALAVQAGRTGTSLYDAFANRNTPGQNGNPVWPGV